MINIVLTDIEDWSMSISALFIEIFDVISKQSTKISMYPIVVKLPSSIIGNNLMSYELGRTFFGRRMFPSSVIETVLKFWEKMKTKIKKNATFLQQPFFHSCMLSLFPK